MSRYQVYKDYAQYKQDKDTRSMDDICSASGEFELQVQQKFLKEFVGKNKTWSKVLLYHQLGSGKTCSSITMAEEYMRLNPQGKVTVILPARLRTNFFDELISPCGMEAYISRADFYTYYNPSTSDAMKKRIRKRFMDAITSKYDIMSFEKFKGLAKKFDSLKEWADYLTRDKMVIVDEVHNLLNTTYESKTLDSMFENHQLVKAAKGSNTLLFRYLAKYADPSSKMVLMTATPIFDNIGQLKELVGALNPENTTKIDKMSDAIEALRGKVSFFPGTSANAYPSSSFETHDIPLSVTQDRLTQKVIEEQLDEENPTKEAFLSNQRQISLACLPKQQVIKDNYNKIVANLKEYAPKIKELIAQLDKPGKHVVYSNFVVSGLYVIKAALDKAGYIDIHTANSLPADKKKDYKVYALWDGSVKDIHKQMIKSVTNSKANIDGRLVKVILGSPSIKEGVSFKHVQHIHMMDPVWNQSSKSQVEGRAIRFCSHVDIDEERHAPLKRSVVIHMYKSTARPKGDVKETCDMRIYEIVIPGKYEEVAKAEDALQRVAMDYYLFRKMYRTSPTTSPTGTPDKQSPVELEKDMPLRKKGFSKLKGNSCPKKRRPDADTDQCPPNHEKRTNKKGDVCCYKLRLTKPKPKCIPSREPDENGKCKEGYYIKTNKKGLSCCYKNKKQIKPQ